MMFWLRAVSDRPNRLAQCLAVFCGVAPASAQAPSAGSADPKAADLPAVVAFTHLEVAKSPLVRNPASIDVDEFGRIFVAEAHSPPPWVGAGGRIRTEFAAADMQAETHEEFERNVRQWKASPVPGLAGAAASGFPGMAACLLDDTGDGVADRRVDFASGFADPVEGPAGGILTWDGAVYFSCAPQLWLLRDKDRDLRADFRAALAKGFGVRGGTHSHTLSAVVVGPDGRLYFSSGDRGFDLHTREARSFHASNTGGIFRCWPDGSELEQWAAGVRNVTKLAFDEFGNLFAADGGSGAGDKGRILHVPEGADFGWESTFQDLLQCGPWLSERRWERPQSGEGNDPVRPAWILPPAGHLGVDLRGLTAFPGMGLPDACAGHFVVGDVQEPGAGEGQILAFRCTPHRAGFVLAGAHVLVSGANAGDIAFGWDARLYVAEPAAARGGTSHGGRIVRLTCEPSLANGRVEEARALLAEGFAELDPRRLCQLLEHGDCRIRLRAQFALSARPARDVLESLLPAARKSKTLTARVHALWALGGLARAQPFLLCEVVPFLRDPDAEIRAQAAKLLGEGRHADALPALLAMLKDPSPRVRSLAALAAGRIGNPSAIDPLLEAAAADADADPWMRHACSAALAECAEFHPDELLRAARQHASRSARLAAVVALRRLAHAGVADFLTDADSQVAAEAARAIFDRQIEESMPALAAALTLPASADSAPPAAWPATAFLLRAIEANYRLGGAEQAERVAQFAAGCGSGEDVRPALLFALEALEKWAAPPVRDRLLGRWNPVGPRPASEAATALRPRLPDMIKAHSGAVLEKLRAMEAKVPAEKSPAALVELAKADAQPEMERLDAFRSLTTNPAAAAQAAEAAEAVLANPAAPSDLRRKARDWLIVHKSGNAVRLIRDALLLGTDSEKQSAAAHLLHLRGSEADKLLLELGQQFADGALDRSIGVEVHEALQHRDERRTPWRRFLERWESQADLAGDPLAFFRPALSGGDAAAGRSLFFTSGVARCSRCHAVRGRGGSTAPDLSGLAARRTADDILQALIVPSARITDGYGVVSAELKDGRVLQGALVSKDSSSVVVLEGHVARTVPVESIAQMSPPVSPMPPMGAALTLRELRDIMAYLKTLK